MSSSGCETTGQVFWARCEQKVSVHFRGRRDCFFPAYREFGTREVIQTCSHHEKTLQAVCLYGKLSQCSELWDAWEGLDSDRVNVQTGVAPAGGACAGSPCALWHCDRSSASISMHLIRNSSGNCGLASSHMHRLAEIQDEMFVWEECSLLN